MRNLKQSKEVMGVGVCHLRYSSRGSLTDKGTFEQRLKSEGASHADGWGKREEEKQETQGPLAETCLICSGMQRRPMGLERIEQGGHTTGKKGRD